MKSPDELAQADIAKIQQDYRDKQKAKRIKAGVPRDESLLVLRKCAYLTCSNCMDMYYNRDFFQGYDETEATKQGYDEAVASFKRNLAKLVEHWHNYSEECKK